MLKIATFGAVLTLGLSSAALAGGAPPAGYGGGVAAAGSGGCPAVRVRGQELTVTVPCTINPLTGVGKPPAGYESAWEDGRLNPYAGRQMLSGALDSALVWTQEVPRRLKTEYGADVTHKYNYLVYPYTSYSAQKAALASGNHVVVSSKNGPEIVPVATLSANHAARAAKASDPAVAPRYVQVGRFSSEPEAQRAAQGVQRTGLTARLVKSGATRTVLAGPFAEGDIAPALKRLHQAGYAGATAR